jgi:hypothetical protein
MTFVHCSVIIKQMLQLLLEKQTENYYFMTINVCMYASVGNVARLNLIPINIYADIRT